MAKPVVLFLRFGKNAKYGGIASLAQNLDLASLDLVRTCLKERRDLPPHAEAVLSTLESAMKRDAEWIKEHFERAAPSTETQVLLRLLIEQRPALQELLKREL